MSNHSWDWEQAFSEGRMPRGLFSRCEKNPILTAAQWPYPANAVFNPGAAQVDGKTLLLVRVEDMRGFSHLSAARSTDGKTDWQIDVHPTLLPDCDYREEQWGLEDPRIVWLEEEEQYAVTYVSFPEGGPLVSLATTRDFRGFTRYGAMVPPEDRNACLLPRRFGSRYALTNRPTTRGEAHIWMSFSPDLKHWGDHRVPLPTRPGWWDSRRVGLGTQPIETAEGWLILYHAVRSTAAGAIYRVGLALLDLEQPWKVIRRSDEWVLGPKERYERLGDVPDVVFPTGAVLYRKANEFRLYYGATDSSVGLALADSEELIEYIKSCPTVG